MAYWEEHGRQQFERENGMDIFDNAKDRVEGEKGREGKVFIEDLYDLKMLKMIKRVIDEAESEVDSRVKNRMREYFIEQGMMESRRPKNFKGYERDAEASCELKKRGTRATLKSWEVELLQEHGIAAQEVVDRKEAYIVNPVYTEDQDLMRRVSEALQRVEGIPSDFIQFQEGSTRMVVQESSLDAVFHKNRSVVEQLLPVVSILAIRLDIDDNEVSTLDVRSVMEDLEHLM